MINFLLTGLNQCHSNLIVHRDLKPENLLLTKDFNLKIGDFGFATSSIGKDGDGWLKTNLGTKPYKAP